jgi:hypothetical protein
VSTHSRPTRPKAAKIVLTSHPGRHGPKPIADRAGARPIPRRGGRSIATVSNLAQRNAIGTHAGSYSVYRAVAVAGGRLDPLRKPDLTDTSPAEPIGPHPQWADAPAHRLDRSVRRRGERVLRRYFAQGYDIRPSIAVTKAHIRLPELRAPSRPGAS